MFISNLILFLFLILCTITDLKSKTISLYLCIIFFICGIFLQFFFLKATPFLLLLNLLPSFFLLLISLLSKGAIGMGDCIIFFILAFYLTDFSMLTIMFFSFLFSSVYCIYLLWKKHSRKHAFPFAPFIAVGTVFFFCISGGSL